MIDYKSLVEASKGLKTIDVKGKNYVQVNDRVIAFRKLAPNGSIVTEIISMDNGTVTMKATISGEDGNVLATGFAQEKESSSYINKTSFIENCETSAVGRALGFLGIGVGVSIMSAEEMENALLNQSRQEIITAKEQAVLKKLIEQKGLNLEEVLNGTPLDKVTAEAYTDAIKRLQKLPEVK